MQTAEWASLNRPLSMNFRPQTQKKRPYSERGIGRELLKLLLYVCYNSDTARQSFGKYSQGNSLNWEDFFVQPTFSLRRRLYDMILKPLRLNLEVETFSFLVYWRAKSTKCNYIAIFKFHFCTYLNINGGLKSGCILEDLLLSKA